MAPAENPFMGRILPMKISNWSIMELDGLAWQMLDLTRMDLSSSLLQNKLTGSMVNTSSSAKQVIKLSLLCQAFPAF